MSLHGEDETQLRAFIRAGELLRPAGEQAVMGNDRAAALHAALPRLTLA